MIKLLPILFAAVAMIGLSGCGKLVLQPTTVQIDASEAIVTTSFPDQEYKYFGGMTRDELRQEYVESLTRELNRGKITVVESGADYVIKIDRISIVEEVETEFMDNQTWKLSRVGVSANSTILQNVEDIPNQMIFETNSEETLEEDKKGKDKYGKGHGGVELRGFGGMDGALNTHAEHMRSELKEHFKSNQ